MDLSDQEEFRSLYRDIQPGLLRYLRVLAGSDAEDVASETWLQVTRDLASFRGDRDGFRGWVITIARHRALDLARRRGRRPALVPVSAVDLAAGDLAGCPGGRAAGSPARDDTADEAIEAMSTDAALRLIATLPPDQAEAVLLRAVVGLDAATAAKVVGKRPGAVRSAAHRGLRTLARRLSASAPAGDPASAPAGDPLSNPPSPANDPAGDPASAEGVTYPRNLALKDMR